MVSSFSQSLTDSNQSVTELICLNDFFSQLDWVEEYICKTAA